MKLSTKTRYGLRILIQLAETQQNNTYIKGKDISQMQDISIKYMEQIMTVLKSAKLLKTYKGHNGGYALSIPSEKITLLNILELLEGKLDFVHCVDSPEACKRASFCPAIKVWQNISKAVRQETETVTLKSLTQ